jgi:acyl-CoA synthetase (AMP-forming)/AMP-acid ligase II
MEDTAGQGGGEKAAETFEAGPIRPALESYDASVQKYAKDVLDKEWTTYYDLLADSEAPFLHSVDGRAPLSLKALKEFIISDKCEVLGLERTERLCTAIPNGPEAAVCFFAFALRCTFAPLNIGLSREEFEFEFIDLPAKALVVQNKESLDEDDQKNAGNAVSVARKAKVPILLELTPDKTTAGLFTIAKHAAGKPMKGTPMGNPLTSVKREDLALVLHTSGTTKKPKIVPLTHQNITCGAQCIASTVQMKPEDICNNTMPLFHIHGLIVNILASAVAGSQVKCVPGIFKVQVFHKALVDAPEPTWYSAVPTMHLQVLQFAEEVEKDKGAPPENKLSLVRNCSAALVPTVSEAMEKTLKVSVMPTYAMTESMPICSNPRYGSRKLRSVGPKAGPNVRIMNGHPDNTELPTGEEGEICVKEGPVTAGYEFRSHMDADPNIEAFGDGWLRTGDKGWMDTEGYVYLSGRFKEIINRAGEKISPFEVEDQIRQHPDLQDCIAFACPHTSLGEVVGIAAVLKPGKKVGIKDLRTWCATKEKLQSKWIPEFLVTMPSIPKGPTGKPARINLAKKINLEPLEGIAKDMEHPGLPS